jgi:hypothetical protein
MYSLKQPIIWSRTTTIMERLKPTLSMRGSTIIVPKIFPIH